MNKIFSVFQYTIRRNFAAFILFYAAIFVFVATSAHGESSISLSLENADWTSVMSGKALCPPQKTSYGFAVLTDGKMISAFTEDGKKLWERGLKGKPEPYLSSFAEDFLLTVNGKTVLSLVNPSGLTLWSKDTGFTITENPIAAKDGRIIVRGGKNIACYGINGINKWTAHIPELQNCRFMELNEGTFLVFTGEKSSDGNSEARILTPFGELSDAVHFSGHIVCAESSPAGVIMIFSDGRIVLCRQENGLLKTKWTVEPVEECFLGTQPDKGAYILNLNQNKSAAALSYSGGLRFILFDTENGRIDSSFNADIQSSNLVYFSKADDGNAILIADSEKICLFDCDGQIKWSALPPSQKSAAEGWNYISYTEADYLVVCRNSWTLSGYRTYQSVKKYRANLHKTEKSRMRFYNQDAEYDSAFDFIDKLNGYFTSDNWHDILLKGGYGQKESEINSALITVCSAYIQIANSYSRERKKTVFDKDSQGLDDVIAQLPLMGTKVVPPLIAEMLLSDKTNIHLYALLKSCAECAYDPDGEMLSAIEQKLKAPSAFSKSALFAVCDCIYEICRFMGRADVFDKGFNMLKKMFSPQYDSEVRQYARETMKKIAAPGI